MDHGPPSAAIMSPIRSPGFIIIFLSLVNHMVRKSHLADLIISSAAKKKKKMSDSIFLNRKSQIGICQVQQISLFRQQPIYIEQVEVLEI